MFQAMLLAYYETPHYDMLRYSTFYVFNEVTLQSEITGYFTLYNGRRVFVPSHLVVINENISDASFGKTLE